jgi:hypothetical protein
LSDTIDTKSAETEKAPDATVDVKALAEQLEQIKKAQAGSDRAFQEASKRAVELATENEKLKKEKMSEKERAEFEFAKKNAELEAKSREVAEATLRLSKMKLMGEKGVSMEYADYITGNTDEEIARNIETFNKRLEKLVGERVEEKLKGTPKPKSGEPSGGKIDMSHMSLKELNKLAVAGKL